jgi:hypothetical protein
VRSFTREVLLGRRAQNRELFRLEQVEPLLDSERDYGRGLWGLLNLELWMQVFLDGQYQFQP